jgi:hypothetical protein
MLLAARALGPSRGQRTGILIVDSKDASDLPRIAEPWFLALNASIEAIPARLSEDLQKAGGH